MIVCIANVNLNSYNSRCSAHGVRVEDIVVERAEASGEKLEGERLDSVKREARLEFEQTRLTLQMPHDARVHLRHDQLVTLHLRHRVQLLDAYSAYAEHKLNLKNKR